MAATPTTARVFDALRALEKETGRPIGILADLQGPKLRACTTPTSAAWLIMVERFFRDITDKRIRRDSFTSVAELELAIELYVAQHNIDPKPFIWTATASDILSKVTRAKAALAAVAG